MTSPVAFGPEAMLPVTPFAVCEAWNSVQLVKVLSGVMPIGKAGRSAIHSALWSWQVLVGQVCTVEKLFPGLKRSVTDRVYEAPFRLTDALIRSPGRTVDPTVTEPPGYISHQV